MNTAESFNERRLKRGERLAQSRQRRLGERAAKMAIAQTETTTPVQEVVASQPVYTTEDWYMAAACAGQETEEFFQPPSEKATKAVIKRYCQQCPVRDFCLEDALKYGKETEGVWGGTTVRESEAMLNRRERVSVRASRYDSTKSA